jgi:hypothetical protein
VEGVLLHRTHPLPDGRRVRVRLPIASDRDGLHELLASLGLSASDMDVRRALRWTPERPVVVAVRWDGAAERVVGFASEDSVIAPAEVAALLREYADRRVA